jgi:predicted hydrocarbon binding protein
VLEPSGLYYPNRIARAFLWAMDDVMGKNGLNAILSLAGLESYIDNLPPDTLNKQFDFAYMAALSQALEDMYGARGGRGMGLRIGRACFANGMKNFGALAGVVDPAFSVLPLASRSYLGLEALASVFTNFSDQQSTVANDETTYNFIVDVSPFAWGRTADGPVCHALGGIIRESLRWASDGYEYHVQETACHAVNGDTCVFRVNKNPVGQL